MSVPCPNCKSRISSGSATGGILRCTSCDSDITVADLDSPNLLKTGQVVGGFEIRSLLGIGGMGHVYLARQLSLDRDVALKVLDEQQAGNPVAFRRFANEIQASAALDHPSIVPVFDAGDDGGIYYLAMAYVEGEALDDRIARAGGPIPEAESLQIIRSVANALDYAWQKHNMIHRDVKPANIMVDVNGDVKIMDMGIAKRLGPESTMSTAPGLTAVGVAVGTPYYISPEQACGSTNLDCRTDVYSTGATLYHLATGQRPFDGGSAVEIMSKHVRAELPSPRNCNPALSPQCARLIEVMMEKAPVDRQANWTEVRADVRAVIKGDFPAKSPTRAVASVVELAVTVDADPIIEEEEYEEDYEVEAEVEVEVEDVAARVTNATTVMTAIGLIVVVALVGLAFYKFIVVESDKTADQEFREFLRIGSEGAEAVEVDAGEGIEEIDPGTDNVLHDPDVMDSPADMDELEAFLRDMLDAGNSPIVLADKYRSDGRLDKAEAVLQLALTDYPGKNGRWAAEAAEALARWYRHRDDLGKYEDVLRHKAELYRYGRNRLAAVGVVELANCLKASEREEEMVKMLKSVIKDRPGGNWIVGARAASRLLDYHLRQKNHADNDECIASIVEQVPKYIPAHRRALRPRKMKDVAGTEGRDGSASNPLDVPDGDGDGDAEDQEASAALRHIATRQRDLRAETEPINKAHLMLEIGRLLRDMGKFKQAADTLRTANEKYGRLDDGVIASEALWELSLVQFDTERLLEWRKTLGKLLEPAHAGRHGEYAARSCIALADYYHAEGKSDREVDWLERVANEFPGENGAEAVAAMTRLVEIRKDSGEIETAVVLLLRMSDEFGASNNEVAAYTEQEMARLKKDHGKVVASVIARRDKVRPRNRPRDGQRFPDFVSFNGSSDFFAVKERTAAFMTAKALSVEAWVRLGHDSRGVQYIVSRCGGNQRGFNLVLRDGYVRWEVFDGRKGAAVETPAPLRTGRWVHLAAEVGKKTGMVLYVNGKRVARRPFASIENDGAGRLKVARASWQEAGYFGGDMRNVLIIPQAIYGGKEFKPSSSIHHRKQAIFAMAVTDGRAIDLKRNRIEGPSMQRRR